VANGLEYLHSLDVVHADLKGVRAYFRHEFVQSHHS
jgi:serine/threonine protein kinase